MRRMLFALVAMFSAALLTVTVAPADAGVAPITGSDAASARADTVAKIQITINTKIIDNTRLKIWGKAPQWRGKPVLLQRKPARGTVWLTVDRERTNRFGQYVFPNAPVPNNCQKEWVFRTKVRSSRYAPSPQTAKSFQRCG